MRLVSLELSNFRSFDKHNKILFDSFNAIIGPNDAGKTNLIRVIEFITNPNTMINDKRINLDQKFDRNSSSYVHVDIHLEKKEMRALFELLFNRTVDLIEYDEDMSKLSIFIEWTNLFDDRSPPDNVILYFHNRLVMWEINSYLNISYIRRLPQTIDEIKSEIEQTVEIHTNQELVQNYRVAHGYAPIELFSQVEFQNSLLSGASINNFFEAGTARVRIKRDPFSVNYNAHDSNQQKAHIVRIFEFVGKHYSSADSVNLWLIVSHPLQKITLQKEIRPNVEELAKILIQVKNLDIDRYNRINDDFSELFPNVYFEALSPEGNTQPIIEIRENRPTGKSGSKHAFNLLESASGYREALYLLLQRSQDDDNVLVLEEPALHLHPNKIRHLSRLLVSTRQIIIITHSPYFVDVTMFGLGRALIYVNRGEDRSSKSFFVMQSAINIKSYIFNPNIFFSNHNILVEGPGDAAVFCAISDALNNIFEKYNITVVNATGVGHIDPYVKVMDDYNVPYVAMVDGHYEGRYQQSPNLFRLTDKLEHELKKAGWNGPLESSIDPDEAYDFVFQTIANGDRDKIRSQMMGKVFDESLRRIGENPDRIWILTT